MNIEEIKNAALNMQASINNDLLKDVLRLRKENAELRECLKESCHKVCAECAWKHYDRNDCMGENHEDCECKKWRNALAKASGEEVR